MEHVEGKMTDLKYSLASAFNNISDWLPQNNYINVLGKVMPPTVGEGSTCEWICVYKLKCWRRLCNIMHMCHFCEWFPRPLILFAPLCESTKCMGGCTTNDWCAWWLDLRISSSSSFENICDYIHMIYPYIMFPPIAHQLVRKWVTRTSIDWICWSLVTSCPFTTVQLRPDLGYFAS